MALELTLAAAAALAIAVVLTGLVRKRAATMQMLDVPNARSSHSAPMPRGGGLGTVLATSLVTTVLAVLGNISVDTYLAITGGGLAVAAVGFLDDRKARPASLRFGVHIVAAVWALMWLGGLPPLRFGDQTFVFGWGGYVLGTLGIVWTLNLFNFMDGIDGIAASEAAFIATAGALIHHLSGGADQLVIVAIVFAAACLGFLGWNWPPAKIFMGDVGSGYMGYLIAVMAIVAARENSVALLVWLILGGAFFIDATVTLIRRALRRERVHEPHRSHAYQWLARRWGSHRRVTIAVLVANVIWLLPCAMVAALRPADAGWVALIALAPVTGAAILLGAGRQELSASSKIPG
jgi:Fuc2NAc and GlcNAc transferase